MTGDGEGTTGTEEIGAEATGAGARARAPSGGAAQTG